MLCTVRNVKSIWQPNSMLCTDEIAQDLSFKMSSVGIFCIAATKGFYGYRLCFWMAVLVTVRQIFTWCCRNILAVLCKRYFQMCFFRNKNIVVLTKSYWFDKISLGVKSTLIFRPRSIFRIWPDSCMYVCIYMYIYNIYIHQMFQNTRYVIWWTLYGYDLYFCVLSYYGSLGFWPGGFRLYFR